MLSSFATSTLIHENWIIVLFVWTLFQVFFSHNIQFTDQEIHCLCIELEWYLLENNFKLLPRTWGGVLAGTSEVQILLLLWWTIKLPRKTETWVNPWWILCSYDARLVEAKVKPLMFSLWNGNSHTICYYYHWSGVYFQYQHSS